MPPEALKPSDVLIGHRVLRHEARSSDRIGLVVAAPQEGFVDVLIEGSATGRSEPWPLKQLTLLPLEDQMVRFGGCFEPPKGYPLRVQLKNRP